MTRPAVLPAGQPKSSVTRAPEGEETFVSKGSYIRWFVTSAAERRKCRLNHQEAGRFTAGNVLQTTNKDITIKK